MSEENEVLEDIVEDLAALIQDEGLTATRLETYGTNIIRLFGVKSAGFVLEQVEDALRELPEDKYTKALTYALGATNPSATVDPLTARRELLMKEEGFKVSEDTLRRWERRAMNPLARHIVAKADEARQQGFMGSRYATFAKKSGSVEERFEAMQLSLDELTKRFESRTHKLTGIAFKHGVTLVKIQDLLAENGLALPEDDEPEEEPEDD